MSLTDVVQSHMELLVAEYLETDDLKVDPNNEVLVTAGTACYGLRVRTDRREPHIEVYSVILTEVSFDPGLLEAINEINRLLGHSRLFWCDDKLVLSGELVGPSATVEAVGCLCGEVAQCADDKGQELSAVFGGKTHTQREEESE